MAMVRVPMVVPFMPMGMAAMWMRISTGRKSDRGCRQSRRSDSYHRELLEHFVSLSQRPEISVGCRQCWGLKFASINPRRIGPGSSVALNSK